MCAYSGRAQSASQCELSRRSYVILCLPVGSAKECSAVDVDAVEKNRGTLRGFAVLVNTQNVGLARDSSRLRHARKHGTTESARLSHVCLWVRPRSWKRFE